jgi:hypothetical protein
MIIQNLQQKLNQFNEEIETLNLLFVQKIEEKNKMLEKERN